MGSLERPWSGRVPASEIASIKKKNVGVCMHKNVFVFMRSERPSHRVLTDVGPGDVEMRVYDVSDHRTQIVLGEMALLVAVYHVKGQLQLFLLGAVHDYVYICQEVSEAHLEIELVVGQTWHFGPELPATSLKSLQQLAEKQIPFTRVLRMGRSTIFQAHCAQLAHCRAHAHRRKQLIWLTFPLFCWSR